MKYHNPRILPAVIDPNPIMMRALMASFEAQEKITIKVAGVEFSCFLRQIKVSGGELLIEPVATGEPKQ